ncbi:hypothetical protein QD460_30730 [Rhizobium jaguaris]|uniref:hypothetical protein n=1 Tax=Rhizobium jaguaris TaxID=1312183 RepID=UPI0039BF3BD0
MKYIAFSYETLLVSADELVAETRNTLERQHELVECARREGRGNVYDIQRLDAIKTALGILKEVMGMIADERYVSDDDVKAIANSLEFAIARCREVQQKLPVKRLH